MKDNEIVGRKNVMIEKSKEHLTECDIMDLENITNTYSTPIIVLSKRRLKETIKILFSDWQRGFGQVPLFYFPLKTNDCDLFLKYLVTLGVGAEVSNLKELNIAIHKLNIKPQNVIANGVAKDNIFLEKAVEYGIVINIDGLSEIKRLLKILKRFGKSANIGIRLRLRGINQFGLSLDDEELKFVLDIISHEACLHFKQIHQHDGSLIRSKEKLTETIHRLVDFSNTLSDIWYTPKICMNLGGGFILSNHNEGEFSSYFDFAVSMKHICQNIQDFDSKFGLAFEWGRSIVNACSFVITRVIGIKKTGGKFWVYVDIGQDNLGGQAGIVYNNIQVIGEAIIEDKKKENSNTIQVIGPLCSSSDIIPKDIEINRTIKEGDILIIENTGAYTIETWNGYSYNPVVLIEDNSSYIKLSRKLYNT